MSKSTFTYDHAFIINLLSGKHSKAIELLDKVDPDSVLKAVKKHKVDSAIGKESYFLPDCDLKKELAEIYEQNKIYQLLLTNELCQIQKWLDEVEFLSLKGPVLSQFLHKDPSERTSWDIDILIDIKDLDKCSQILQDQGYDLTTIFNTKKQKEAIIKYRHHFEFYNATKGILIELHWELTDMQGLKFELKDLTPYTSHISIYDNQFRILDIEHQFEYLSIHGTFHLFHRLQWLCDLKTFIELLSEEQLNSIISYSKRNGTYKFILVSFNLLNQVFEIPLELSMQKDIDANNSVKRLTELSINEMYINSSDATKSAWHVLARNHKTQYYASGFIGLLKSLFARNVRPKNWQFFAFPDSVFFLNHLFSRIVWLVGKVAGKL